jgi:lysophospholipase L1-like esterase
MLGIFRAQRPTSGTEPADRGRALRTLGLLGLAWTAACSGSKADSVASQALTPRRATWAASPQDYAEVFPGGTFPAPMPLSFSNQSLRQIVHVSIGGTAPRVRFSNLFGTAPLALTGAHLAPALGGSRIDTKTDVALTFDGKSSVSIPAGQELWSDPASLDVPASSDLAVTLYLSGDAAVSTVHSVAQSTAFATSGSALSDAQYAMPVTSTMYYWITGVDVDAPAAKGVVVAFGDSITDGVGSTLDANHRYPNYLAQRLAAQASTAGYGVVNEGISGNRVLHDVAGPSALSRFQRDALGNSGASDVIILIGINDIGFSGIVPADAVSTQDISNGLATLVQQAHGAGLRAFLATLTPFEGTMASYYSDAGEMEREAVNSWIRSNRDVDGVVDFDAVMQDPSDPKSMRSDLNSGDHLHPNDLGYQTMANAIDLDAL